MKKSFKLLLTLGLAVTGMAAVGAGISSNSSVIEESKASIIRRFYLDTTTFGDWGKDNAAFKFQTWESSTGDLYTNGVKAADYYWYADVDISKMAGFRWVRCSSDFKTNWNQGAWEGSNLDNYYYKPSGMTSGNWYKPNSQIKGGTNHWATTDIELEFEGTSFDGNGLQFYHKNVSFSKDTEFKIINDGKYLGYKSSWIADNAQKYLSGTENSDITQASNILVKEDVVLEIYSKPLIDQYWIQISSVQEAKEFSSTFTSATDPICATSGDHQSALSAIWGTHKTAFEAMTVGGKSKFNTDSDTTIAGARERYTYLVGKYDLAIWTGGPVSASLIQTKSNLILGESTGLTIVIVVCSVVALSTIAGFVIIRKRKAN